MTVRRLLRYLVSLGISIGLIMLIAPHFGIPQTHLLPPAFVYKGADANQEGNIVEKIRETSNNPFRIGEHNYFLHYRFYAKTIVPDKPKPVQLPYDGKVRVDKETFDDYKEGEGVHVQYVSTYPWVNGLTRPDIGLGCGEGSDIISGWLMWAGGSLVLGYFMMMLVELIRGVREDF